MFNKILIVCSLFFVSCKSYDLTLTDFKNQRPYIKKHSIVFLDSINNKIYMNGKLDSVFLINTPKKIIKLNPKDYKFIIKFQEESFLHLSKKIIADIVTTGYNEIGIITFKPSPYGILQRKSKNFIPFKSIEKIKIKNLSNLDNKLSIKSSPLSLINLIEWASLKLSFELKLYKNISTNIEGGIYLPYYKNGYGGNINGYLINADLRYYFNKNKLTTGRYIALDCGYKNQRYNWGDSIKLNTTHFEKYIINSISNKIGLKYGDLRIYSNRFVVECFFGIALKMRTNKTSLSDDERNAIVRKSQDYSYIDAYKSSIGNYISPNVTAGLRVGFLLR